MSTKEKLTWFFTIGGFTIAVAMAIKDLINTYGKNPDFVQICQGLKVSFVNFGVIYSYAIWVIFLTVYIVLTFHETVHGQIQKRDETNLEAKNYFYTLWVWGIAAIIVNHLTLASQSNVVIHFVGGTIYSYVFAICLGLWGMYLVISGRVYINGYWTNHIYKYPNHKVVQSGIYEKVRHPIYGGQCFLMLSIFIACNNYWLFFLPLMTFIYNYKRAKREENELDRILNGQYEVYRKKCPTFMFHPW